MAPFNPQANLRSFTAGCLIMVGSNDSVASPNLNAEPAYNDLPDSIDKCLLEIRSSAIFHGSGTPVPVVIYLKNWPGTGLTLS
jgi:hypothetical protein